ncbi:MAG: OmpA family protein [Bacteroidia bacterium]|nr:OmpA family protein [Bacteroidia bacterium]
MKLFWLITVALLLNACVPSKQYKDLKYQYDNCKADIARLSADNLAYTTRNKDLELQLAEAKQQVNTAEKTVSQMQASCDLLKADYDKLNTSYNNLVEDNKQALNSKDTETKKALNKLQSTQEELFKRQDELQQLNAALAEQKKALNNTELELQKREQKVSELQRLLAEKDSITLALKNKVAQALGGFINNGLKVEQRNGNVYVSMDEKLLFASGSTVVDKNGEVALKNLAQVLAENPDINVEVEGHTDNVPISGGAIKDNWDLSVLRATSVTKILLNNKLINPKRIVPSGRSEYVAIAKNDNADNKKKNRRIEIILKPNLDALMELLEKK